MFVELSSQKRGASRTISTALSEESANMGVTGRFAYPLLVDKVKGEKEKTRIGEFHV